MVSRGRLEKRTTERRKKVPNPAVLIVCEGKETEPNYFRGFRQEHRIQRERFLIHSPKETKHTDPKGLVDYAFAQTNKAANLARGYFLDTVFCVFDKDQHPTFAEASLTARERNIVLGRSNPCFEFWLLLHFKDHRSHIERGNVQHELKAPERLPNYEKNIEGLYAKLKANQETAISRAKHLRAQHQRDNKEAWHNPSTEVDTVLSTLKEVFDLS